MPGAQSERHTEDKRPGIRGRGLETTKRGDRVGGLGQRKAGRSETETENLRHAFLLPQPTAEGGEHQGPASGTPMRHAGPRTVLR